MLEKLKNTYQKLLFGNQHTVNHLIKTMLVDPTNPRENIFLKARYTYLSRNKYNRNISQGERIMLSNLLVHNYENTIRELPHFLYHTIENKWRLQILPDINIFNLEMQKYGDFLNIKTQESIEVKTFYKLSNKCIEDTINQYKSNIRNNEFKFSIFYKEIGSISREESIYKLKIELNLSEDQIIIKSLDSILKNITDDKISTVIAYYNISWLEYQSEINKNLFKCINELLDSSVLDLKSKQKILDYKKRLLGEIEPKSKKQKFNYPYKNTLIFLDDKTQVDPIDTDQLTPEDYMADVQGWMFKEDE